MTTTPPPLLRDWCEAHQLAYTDMNPDRLAAFTRQVPQSPRRLRTLTRFLRDAGAPIDAPPEPEPDGCLRRRSGEWLPVDEALGRCPRRGRAGVRGRRDAFILACLEAGLTRRAVHHLTVGDVAPTGGVVAGRDLPRGEGPHLCRRCVTVQWVRVLGELVTGGRAAALRHTSTVLDHHLCDEALVRSPEATVRAWPLVPGIDRHGWAASTPLTPRAITAVVTARTDPTVPVPAERPAPRPRGDVDVRTELDRVGQLLDALDEHIAALEQQSPGLTGSDWQP